MPEDPEEPRAEETGRNAPLGHCRVTAGRQENHILKTAAGETSEFLQKKSQRHGRRQRMLRYRFQSIPKHLLTVRLKFPPQVNCYLRVRKLRRFKTKRLKRFSIYRTQLETN